jgi:hypothetical protein
LKDDKQASQDLKHLESKRLGRGYFGVLFLMVGIHSIETDHLETSCLVSGGGEDVVWFAHSCLAKARDSSGSGV